MNGDSDADASCTGFEIENDPRQCIDNGVAASVLAEFLSMEYIGLLLITLTSIRFLFLYSQHKSPKRLAILVFIVCGCLIRIVLFGIYPYTCFRGHVFAVRLDVTCQSVASIFFILSYSIILYQWIKMYLTARAFIKNREFMPTSVINLPLKLTMLCANSLLLIGIIVCLVGNDVATVNGDDHTIRQIFGSAEYLLLGIYYITAGTLFSVFGILLYRAFSTIVSLDPRIHFDSKRKLKIIFLIMIIPSCFIVRSLLLLLQHYGLQCLFYFEFTYYNIIELFPLVLLVSMPITNAYRDQTNAERAPIATPF